MGRNPLFAEHVIPIHTKKTIPELESIFSVFFQTGEIVFHDDAHIATISKPIYLSISGSDHAKIPFLERSCSVYRKTEDYFPEEKNIYQIVNAIRYKFCNRHSGNKPFEYHVLEIVNTDMECYTTFCIRTDGAILNLESLSLRGYCSHVQIASSTQQLCVG